VKLLLDQNLSRRLVKALSDAFPGSTHVASIGLDTADDRTVWDYAKEHGFTIVSKDTDFHHLCFLYDAPPKAVWIRLGNCTTGNIEALLRVRASDVEAFGEDESAALLVLP
jgi:predicted nuclease of predicted toxin-antitoxin system